MFFVYLYICTHKIANMRHTLTSILLILTALFTLWQTPASAAQKGPRTYYSINDGWRFYHTQGPNTEVTTVDLPHTWSNPGECLYSTASYTRQISVPHSMRGKRLFLRFGGVMSTASLFVNGQFVGEHRGSYTAFTFEITDKVRYGETNSIKVVVSNTKQTDLLPVSTDHNISGGIYRDVELIVTNRNIVSPTFYSSDGVFVHQNDVTKELAKGVVIVHLSALDEGAHTITVRFIDPAGYEVEHYVVKAGKSDRQSGIEIPYAIKYPDLWSPESPTMYRVEVSVGSADKPSDLVSFDVGFRKVSLNSNNKLMINGKVVDVRGVNLTHDREDVGVAIGDEHILSDLDMVQDMGANAIRSIVGPHRQSLYKACDSKGMLAWIDMPFTCNSALYYDVCYYPTARFQENGFEQLREIIYQNYNHPSVVMWGIFSLLSQRGDDATPYVKELNKLAHLLDQSRPTVACSNTDGDINYVTDLIVLRQDVGWSKGSYDDVRLWCRQLTENVSFKNLHYAVCYGEDGCVSHIVDNIQRVERDARLRPERAQTLMHESYAALLKESDIFWGVWLDNMFDHASMHERDGMDYSGMVCWDHETMKDSYYLYRALWNKRVPTLHIAERRWKRRCDELQSIRVYSSVGSPTLIVDGKNVEMREVSSCCWQADSVVIGEQTTIQAIDATGTHRDIVELKVDKMRVAR